MTKDAFIKLLQDELEYENELYGNTLIKELEEWDSMSAMILIGVVAQNFGVTLKANDIEAITTIDSILEIIGSDKFN
jgi:acyl carrier protein